MCPLRGDATAQRGAAQQLRSWSTKVGGTLPLREEDEGRGQRPPPRQHGRVGVLGERGAAATAGAPAAYSPFGWQPVLISSSAGGGREAAQ